jgi:NAD(P)H-hydrate epimerase
MSILQTAVPEAMLSVDPHQTIFSRAPSVDSYEVIGMGPGIGQAETSIAAFREVLEFGKPMVIDADALNMLGAHRELMQLVPPGSILTPHPREFERLTGKSENDFDRLAKQLSLASELKSIVLVKGAHTAIATPDGAVYFNSTGNPGMATAGSGDVLTGILTGLLAQGYSAKEAAILGVYLHGLAGDLAAKEKSQHALIASDLTDFLPAAYAAIC